MCVCLCMNTSLCVLVRAYKQAVKVKLSPDKCPFSQPPKAVNYSVIYCTFAHHTQYSSISLPAIIFVSISELPPLCSIPSSATIGAQRQSTEREQSKPHAIWGTKASITEGKIQEQLTFLNRTISTTCARYTDISYYTWQNKSILPFYSLLYFLCLSPEVKKRLCETTKGSANGENCRGRVTELATVIRIVSYYEATSNATDAQRKRTQVNKPWLLRWVKTLLKCSHCRFPF